MAAVAKYPDSTKTSLEQRLRARARERWPQIASLHIRHRGAFSYIDATLTDATTLKLCRLRYVGSAHNWQFAIYRASHDDYDESVFFTGLPVGTCQDALDTACGLYLNDPTAWNRPPTNLRAGPHSGAAPHPKRSCQCMAGVGAAGAGAGLSFPVKGSGRWPTVTLCARSCTACAVRWPLRAVPRTGARHDATAHHRRCPVRARAVRGRVDRPDVPQRLPAEAAVRRRGLGVLRGPPRAQVRVVGADGADHRGVRGEHPSLHRCPGTGPAVLRQGRGQGRHRAPVPGRLPRQGRGAVRRPRAGEGVGVPHPEAPQPGDREGVPVADPRDAAGQLLLLLLRR